MKKLALKKYHIQGLVLKLNSRLCFSPPFTGGKKYLEFPPGYSYFVTVVFNYYGAIIAGL